MTNISVPSRVGPDQAALKSCLAWVCSVYKAVKMCLYEVNGQRMRRLQFYNINNQYNAFVMFRADKEDSKSKEEILAEIKQRVEERIQAYSSIQRLHEDIENCKLLLIVHCF